MIGVIEGFGIIFIVIAVGFLLAKTKVLGDKGMFVLNKYVFYAAYPCLMYDLIAKKHVQDVLGIHFVIGIVTALATIFVFLIINKFFLKLKGSAAVFACLSGVYLNSNNIGLPVATYVLKDSTMLIPIMIFQIAILAPISLAILDYLSNKEANNGKKVSLKRIISTPVRNPLVLGVILGIVGSLFGSENINWMMIPNHVCNMIGESAIPVVLISYGMSLYGSKFFDNKK
ncbi:MAG: AEC family transporter [Candidatus Ancillula sp.]|jgi:predicted permease|nr:AEC family transporter [Candidatus Ancillula sp.]